MPCSMGFSFYCNPAVFSTLRQRAAADFSRCPIMILHHIIHPADLTRRSAYEVFLPDIHEPHPLIYRQLVIDIGNFLLDDFPYFLFIRFSSQFIPNTFQIRKYQIGRAHV